MRDTTGAGISYPVSGSESTTATGAQGYWFVDLLPESLGLRPQGTTTAQVVSLPEAARTLAYLTQVLSPGEPGVVDRSGGRPQQPASQPALPEVLLRRAADVVSALEAEAVEYGQPHPAEEILLQVLKDYPGSAASWAKQIVNSAPPAVIADFIRCLGRHAQIGRQGWGYRLAGEALKSANVVIRDAAILALEAWEGPEAVEILQEHLGREPEDWLRNYAAKVIRDLQS